MARRLLGALSNLLTVMAFLGGASPLLAGGPAARAASMPDLLKRVEAKYRSAKTLTAEFEQVDHLQSLDRLKKSRGKIWLKRPDKVHWKTESPAENLLVSDGKKFWFYTPPMDEDEPGQVLIRRSSDVQSQFARALLSGEFSMAKSGSIRIVSVGEFILDPQKGTAGTVQEARIRIDPKNLLIQSISLKHQGGNRTDISLTRIELGSPIKDEFFRFSPPPGTAVVSTDSK